MRNNLWKQMAFGAVAGFAGTVVIQSLLMAHRKVSPETMPPISRDPGEFMVSKAKAALPAKAQVRVPPKAEAVSAKLLGLGYGMAFGALYAVARPRTQRSLLEGTLLGIAAWAVGYLGWLPGAKLMKPVWKQNPAQVIVPLAEHAMYGVATVAGYHWLQERVEE
jgi:hypothetical protein